ncbi:MAG: helix-turn-helix domain-containing protein [Deferribacteraceae bacterium]|jgi:phage repressor protein C with HTH and peptisase S24 domain|nr:helix-turn-helix domain-containing protein [Deferribacteraceae bacterium]
MNFANRIRSVRKNLNITQTAFGERLGKTITTVQNWESGRNTPDEGNIMFIAQMFNVNYRWLSIGEGDMHDGRKAAPHWSIKSAENNVITSHTAISGIPGSAAPVDISDFVFIPRYALETSTDGEIIGGHENVVDVLAFQKKWINKLSYPANTLSLITVIGDSMTPTFKDNDVIMITTDMPAFAPGLYIVRDCHGLRLKRLYKDKDGGLHLISDNAVYPEEVYSLKEQETGVVVIAGRVIWYGRNV